MTVEARTFQEKLNLILEELDASNSQIASQAGFDRTNLSHFRSGKRIPEKNGTAAKKLVNGLLQYAQKEGKLPQLKALIGMKPNIFLGGGGKPKSTPKELSEALLNWLFEGDSDCTVKEKEKNREDTKAFGERFDWVMKLVELSNNRLAQLLNVDASLVSRYRSGKRKPRANSEISEMMGMILWQRMIGNGKEKELARLMHAPEHEIQWEGFYKWLFQEGLLRDQGLQPAEKLVNSFEVEPQLMLDQMPDVRTILGEEPPDDRRDEYYGIQGIRDAVLRFLSGVLESGAKELMLFSEEGMEWMTGDAAFRTKWAVLMSECVKAGVRIHIIHHIERDLREMTDAIQSWLPLYLTGMIDPWYLNKLPDNRFTHTLFLCPDHFAIEAAHVAGMESEGVYHFLTEGSQLSRLKKSFEKLMEHARPLISFSYPEVPVFQKARISVYPKTVVVTHGEEPKYSFSFTHPAMVRAFRAYIEQ